MIVKFLGVIDIIAALIFWVFGIFHILPSSLVLVFAFVLLAKGIFFIISEHFASVLDVVISIVMFLSVSFNLPKFIIIIFAFLLIQKGIISLM